MLGQDVLLRRTAAAWDHQLLRLVLLPQLPGLVGAPDTAFLPTSAAPRVDTAQPDDKRHKRVNDIGIARKY
jgi:hypothetical protein